MGLFRVLIYGICLSVYAGALIYDIRFMPRIGDHYWVYKLVMLTMINLCLQTVYSLICFSCALFDFSEEIVHTKEIKHAHVPSYWYERKTMLHKICDFMYSTSAFPIGITTCLFFWILFIVNPKLVIYGNISIPAWLNHVTHTAPLAFLLVDTILTCHHMPDRMFGSLTVLGLFTIYASIILIVRFLEGYWLYPIFHHLSTMQISLLFAVTGILFWFLYLTGDGLNTLLWGKAPHSVDKSPRKPHLISKKKE